MNSASYDTSTLQLGIHVPAESGEDFDTFSRALPVLLGAQSDRAYHEQTTTLDVHVSNANHR